VFDSTIHGTAGAGTILSENVAGVHTIEVAASTAATLKSGDAFYIQTSVATTHIGWVGGTLGGFVFEYIGEFESTHIYRFQSYATTLTTNGLRITAASAFTARTLPKDQHPFHLLGLRVKEDSIEVRHLEPDLQAKLDGVGAFPQQTSATTDGQTVFDFSEKLSIEAVLVIEGAVVATGNYSVTGEKQITLIGELSGGIPAGSRVFTFGTGKSDGSAGLNGDDGDDGWTPRFAVVSDGARRVLEVVDWFGGTGTKPDAGMYVGATGYVALIGDAIDIRGAAGLDGADGLDGAAGLDGADGAAGLDGAAGADGADGASAYQIWLSLGNSGNEADFIASLQGADGADGAAGQDGAAGADGADGAAGQDGADGADGDQQPTLVAFYYGDGLSAGVEIGRKFIPDAIQWADGDAIDVDVVNSLGAEIAGEDFEMQLQELVGGTWMVRAGLVNNMTSTDPFGFAAGSYARIVVTSATIIPARVNVFLRFRRV
jgi:hypothetical protein